MEQLTFLTTSTVPWTVAHNSEIAQQLLSDLYNSADYIMRLSSAQRCRWPDERRRPGTQHGAGAPANAGLAVFLASRSKHMHELAAAGGVLGVRGVAEIVGCRSL